MRGERQNDSYNDSARSAFGLGWRLLLLCCCVPVALTAMAAMAEEAQGIQVAGTGLVNVTPDMARMTLEVSREGSDAVALNTEVDAVTAEVLKLARSLAIEPKDMVAATINIRPNRHYGDKPERADSVLVSRSINLTIRDLERLPDLVNRSLKLGINGVGAIQLDTSRRVELEREALALAITDAQEEAARVAEGFSVRLTGLQSAEVDAHQAVPQMARMMDTGDSGGAFAPGEMTLRRSVRAKFGIAPPQ